MISNWKTDANKKLKKSTRLKLDIYVAGDRATTGALYMALYIATKKSDRSFI